MRLRNLGRAVLAGVAAARSAMFDSPVTSISPADMPPPAITQGNSDPGPRIVDAKTGGRSYLATMEIYPFNPDDLVRFKGGNLRVYQLMMKEPFIKVPWMLKITQALADGWTITPASDDPLHIEQADWATWNLQNIMGGMLACLRAAGGGMLIHGFSLGEKVPWIVDDGEWAGMIGWKAIRDLDPNAFEFVVDEFRRILGVTYANAPNMKAPEFGIEEFLHCIWMQMHSDPHGTSDWRASHRAAWLYDTVSKLRARYVEKFAVPWIVATSKRTLFEQEENDFWAAVTALQEDACILLYDGQSIEIKQAVSDQQSFETLLGRLQMEMIVNSMGSHLAITEGNLQGAKAAGEIHASTSNIMVGLVKDVLVGAISEQLIRPIIEWNYTECEEMPLFTLTGEQVRNKEDVELETAEIANDSDLMQMGVPMSVPQLQQKYKRPPPDEGEEPANPKSGGGGGLSLPGLGLPHLSLPGEPSVAKEDNAASGKGDATSSAPGDGPTMTADEAMAFAEEIGAGLPASTRKQIATRLLNEERAYQIGVRQWNKRVVRYRAELQTSLEKKRPSAR